MKKLCSQKWITGQPAVSSLDYVPMLDVMVSASSSTKRTKVASGTAGSTFLYNTKCCYAIIELKMLAVYCIIIKHKTIFSWITTFLGHHRPQPTDPHTKYPKTR